MGRMGVGWSRAEHEKIAWQLGRRRDGSSVGASEEAGKGDGGWTARQVCCAE